MHNFCLIHFSLLFYLILRLTSAEKLLIKKLCKRLFLIMNGLQHAIHVFRSFQTFPFSVCLHIFICLLYKYLLWSCCFHGKKIALPARFCHEKRHTTALTEEANGCILGKNNGSIIFLNSHFLNSCDFTKYDAIIFHIKNL